MRQHEQVDLGVMLKVMGEQMEVLSGFITQL